jgi:DNA polymerase sigma
MKFDDKKQKRERERINSDFKQWVTSLNQEELLDSMAFTFESNMDNSKNSISLSSTTSLSPSHDYELLSQMVQQQPPPSTPVHPRATGYKPRSQKGVRLDYFYKEEEHLRWTKPRLFQWVEQRSSSINNNDNGNFGGRSSRNYNNKRNNNNNTGNNNNTNNAAADTRRFQVIARQKVAPWGDVYSLGCTLEQEDADCKLIQGTRLGRNHNIHNGRKYNATACFVCHQGEENGKRTASSILNMLRIASRGQFLQQQQQQNHVDSKASHGLSYCAPWLQPTERWFSLSMYIASRFQMALWNSYQNNQIKTQRRQHQQQHQQQYTNHPGRIIRGPLYDYEESVIQAALIRAITLGLKEILKEEQKSSQLHYLRDGTLWSLLERNPIALERIEILFLSPQSLLLAGNPNDNCYWKNIARTWTQTRLVEMHIPHNSRFKCLVSHKLEEELVKQMERVIFEEEMETKNNDVADNFNNNKKRKKIKRKRKKKRNNPALPVIPDGIEKDDDLVSNPSDLSSKDDDDDEKEKSRCSTLPLDFPKNKTSTRDRNRNIIFVLGILEEITDKVFTDVGLKTSQKTEEFDENTPVGVATNVNSELHSSLLDSSEENATMNENIRDAEASANFLSTIKPSRKDDAGPINACRSLDQEATNHCDNNAFSLYTRHNESLPSVLYNSFMVDDGDMVLDMKQSSSMGGEVNNLPFVNRYQSRERSILTNFFQSSRTEKMDDKEDEDDEERLMAASTAASIASSTYNKDIASAVEAEEMNVPDNVVTEQTPVLTEMSAIRETDDAYSKCHDDVGKIENYSREKPADTSGYVEKVASIEISFDFDQDAKATASFDEEEEDKEVVAATAGPGHREESTHVIPDSISPEAPITPPPTLSPIVVSLADLKKLKYDSTGALKRFPSLEFESTSLPPNSPANGLINKNWSGEDLRIESFLDDHSSKKLRRDELQYQRELEAPTYKSVAVKSLARRPIRSPRADSGSLDQGMQLIESSGQMQGQRKESCAQSETAMDAHRGEHQDWYREEAENQYLTRDETTTIISGISHRAESEELAAVREERNNFQDMCLTLGAEVAKLKVMLATRQAAAATPVDFHGSFTHPQMYGSSTDPHGMQPFFHGINNGVRPGPMSDGEFIMLYYNLLLFLSFAIPFCHCYCDVGGKTKTKPRSSRRIIHAPRSPTSHYFCLPKIAALLLFLLYIFHQQLLPIASQQTKTAGFFRHGDHESLFSEDEVYDPISKVREARIDCVRRMPSNQTITGSSDASIDFNNSKSHLSGGQITGTMPVHDYFHFNSLQSRLTKDILQYLDATSTKLRKLDGGRKLAVERFSRLVKTIWPRAQVKLYGSYISGLCLPSSDLDFVVCLPAVHKKDLALAPGVLEGRNALNTSHQKLLARELKGESWIDPRSIKVIERTVVPVIKVSTKDTRARMIQLDISFDGPEHHGLEANQMVTLILEELPLIRPLMLVLKQFLLRRGLLTAYTGGLSSYCLFLMVARYLQEQPLSGDCGSLLMGFLDFYGNCFDPRAIGISVRGRQYFARTNSHTAVVAGYEPPAIWNGPHPHQHQQHVVTNIPNPTSSIDFRRRNSFSDAGSVDDSRRRHPRLFAKPTGATVSSGSSHRFVPRNAPSHPKVIDHPNNNNTNPSFDNVRPFTFDPLFVEDPLSSSNNVGRNAFRINQVQRAFSDAHRALVASLEWGESAEGAGKYPLLKCLLGENQREDVLNELY